MDTFDRELEQPESFPLEGPRRLNEEELSWLEENGGSGEGIIICIAPILGVHQRNGKTIVTYSIGESDFAEFRVGEKTNMPPEGFQGQSLLTPREPTFEKNLPAFFWPSRLHEAALVGLHFNDFLRIESSPYNSNFQMVRAKAFLTLDLMGLMIPPLGRKIAVNTILGGLRTLKIAENWQDRLRKTMPFGFRKWDEVLDVIEEK